MLADTLTHDDVANIVRLVDKLHKSSLHFIRIESDGLVLSVSKDGANASVTAAGTPLRAGNVGVFRGGKEIRIGSSVEPGTPMGAIHTLDEVNAVQLGISGTITAIEVRDGDFVEFGQPLFMIDPANEVQP